MEQETAIDNDNSNSPTNFIRGILCCSAAGALGSLVWILIAAFTGYSIGWIAVGIGFLVGLASGFGDRSNPMTQISAVIISLLSVTAGMYLGAIANFAHTNPENIGFFTLLSNIGLDFELLKEVHSPISILFYGIAAYQSWKMSSAN
jgi:hypothetical protein